MVSTMVMLGECFRCLGRSRYGDPSWVLVELLGKRLSDQPVNKLCRIPVEDIIDGRRRAEEVVQAGEVGQIFE